LQVSYQVGSRRSPASGRQPQRPVFQWACAGQRPCAAPGAPRS